MWWKTDFVNLTQKIVGHILEEQVEKAEEDFCLNGFNLSTRMHPHPYLSIPLYCFWTWTWCLPPWMKQKPM
jgi:hypothetical protein